MTRYGTAPASQRSPAAYDFQTPFSIGRKRRRGDPCARWTTKAVVLSPLLILTLWSIIVMFAGTKKIQQSPSAQLKRNMKSNKHHSAKAPFRPKRKWGSASVTNPNTSRQELVVQPEDAAPQQQVVNGMSIAQQGFVENGSITPQVMQSGKAKFESDNEAAIRDNHYLGATGEALSDENIGAMGYSHGDGGQAIESGMLLIQQQQPLSSVSSVQPEMFSQNRKRTRGESVLKYQSTGVDVTQTRQDNQITNGVLTSQGNLQELDKNNQLGQSSNVIIRPSFQDSPSSGKTKVLYYDPQIAMIDGQSYVPKHVFDANGNEVDLHSFQSTDTRIYIEPPSLLQTRKSIPLQQMGKGDFQNLSLVTPQVQRSLPSQKLSRNELQHIASEPPAQDQYIIIATVAVMALLVGALSARRLRSRNFLSSCIENESLEDEIAYDVATTAGDYSTFSAGNWRGDLEKFDV